MAEPLPTNYGSRKFVLAIVSLALLTGMSGLTIWFPAIETLLPAFVSGILGINSLYFSGNIVNKFVVGKTSVGFETTSVTEKGTVEGEGGEE
jgi:hypothetical protein